MRRFISAAMLLSLLATVGSSAAAGQGPAKGKIRVFLTYGGHGFEEKPFFAMFDSLPGVVYTKAELPKATDLLKPSLKKDYDVIVMYDRASYEGVPEFTREQQKAFVELLNTGIGLVSLHHNLGITMVGQNSAMSSEASIYLECFLLTGRSTGHQVRAALRTTM